MSDQALVVDVGSSSVKAGFSGEDWPSTLLPSVVDQYPKGVTCVEPSSAEYYGSEISAKSSHPVHRGQVKNWDQLEMLWGDIMKDVGTGKHMPSVMLCESMVTKHEDRKRWAEMLFETFHVPSICLANCASLSLFASGRTTGLVAEAGAGLTSVVPIFEGLVLQHAATTVPFGGQDVSVHLQSLLMERGTQLDMHDIRVMKESMSYVRTADSAPASETMRYELPDGREVETDGTILSEATEKLVCNTSVVPEGLAAQLFEAVKLCDDTLRYDLASNIVLAGGSSLCTGLGDRLQEDLTRSFAADAVLAECNVKVHPSKAHREAGYTTQRQYAAWIGGSIIASMDSYKHLRITRQEWEEQTDNVLMTKCI